jgi:hypothetical protein
MQLASKRSGCELFVVQEEDNEENSSNPGAPEPPNLSDSSKNGSSENSKGSGLGKSKKVFKENKRFKNFTNETIYRNYRNLSLEFPQNETNKLLLSESLDHKEEETYDDDRNKERNKDRSSLRDRDIEMFSTAKEKHLQSTKGKNRRFPKPEEFESFLEGLKEANTQEPIADTLRPGVAKVLSDLEKTEENFVELGKFNSLESNTPDKEERQRAKETEDSIDPKRDQLETNRSVPAWSQTPETKPRLEKEAKHREFNSRGGSPPVLRGRSREAGKRKSLSFVDWSDTMQRHSLPNKVKGPQQIPFMFGSSKETGNRENSGKLTSLQNVRNKGIFKTVDNLLARDTTDRSCENLKQNGKEKPKKKSTLGLQLSILKKLTDRQSLNTEGKSKLKGSVSILNRSSQGQTKIPHLNISDIHQDKSRFKQTPLNSDRVQKDIANASTSSVKPKPDFFRRYLKTGDKPVSHRSFQDNSVPDQKRKPGSLIASLISSISKFKK